jgi:hypothetical protein
MEFPPATEQAVSIDLMPSIARLDSGQLPPPFVARRGTPVPGNCSLSHADGGGFAIPIHWNHADNDMNL